MALPPFKPSKEMSWTTLQKDWERLQNYLQRIQEEATVDLSEVESCDSSGLSLLVAGKKWCLQHNKRYHIAGSKKNISALAKFCGVSELLGL